jgi:dihydroneopterin aldolase
MSDSPPDRIEIFGLTVFCILGTQEWERLVKSEVVIDLTVYSDLQAAARSDSVGDTADYAAIAAAVSDYARESHFKLAESLAQGIADVCLGMPNVERIDVRLQKKGPLGEGIRVTVAISRCGD